MDADSAKRLREPFAADIVGKLPRVYCGKCRNAQFKVCDQHQSVKCNVCNNKMTTAHLHIDYVGHAAITDRLLQVDAEWTWEPMALDAQGLPAVDKNGGLWIRLSVAGVTRLGYGDAEGKTGPSAVKEAIGDALRNGAMRFGVGLDLWHRDGVLAQHDDDPTPPAAQPDRNGAPKPPAAPAVSQDAKEALEELAALCDAMSLDREMVAAEFARRHNGADVRKAATPEAAALVRAFISAVDDMDPTRLKKPVPASNGAAQ